MRGTIYMRAVLIETIFVENEMVLELDEASMDVVNEENEDVNTENDDEMY